MEQPNYVKIAAMAEMPESMKKSVSYLQKNMTCFLKKGERVLILFPKKTNASCEVLDQAIRACDCTPVWLGEDQRWMTILRTAFTTKSQCIVGPPLMLLGLSKLARYMGTPLYVRNVMMSGYPSTMWLVDGVRKGLDCMAWGCFDPGNGAVIAGFTCSQLDGVHIRTEEYTVEILDEEGKTVPAGEAGRITLFPNGHPELRFANGDRGRIDRGPCPCGSCDPKLVDVDTEKYGIEALSVLGESLHYWSSILDCRVEKTAFGLELELIVFPGEKLPKLPTVAKQIVRPFDPEKDAPFAHHDVLKKRYL